MPVLQVLRDAKRTLHVHTVSRVQLRRLARGPAPAAALAAAVGATIDHRLDPGEREWVDRIEALRQRLLANDDPLGEGVDPGLGTPADKTVGEAAVGTSPRHWGIVLMKLVRELGATTCLELGTSLGISAAYMAAGMSLDGGLGRVITLEGSGFRADRALRHWDELGLTQPEVVLGDFDETLGPAVTEAGTVDCAFLDGNHEPGPTLRYTDQILAGLAPRGILAFDDIGWSQGMTEAWRAVSTDPRVEVALDLQKMGICSYPGGTDHTPVHASITTRPSSSDP